MMGLTKNRLRDRVIVPGAMSLGLLFRRTRALFRRPSRAQFPTLEMKMGFSTAAFASEPKIHNVPVRTVNEDNIKPYGSLFDDFEAEQIAITPWPQPGWRQVEDGVSGGTTQGDFVLEWRGGAHYAVNTGVKEGAYCFAWADPNSAIAASKEHGKAYEAYLAGSATRGQNDLAKETKNGTSEDLGIDGLFMFYEINYHACGGQLFYSADAPIVLLVASLPKDRFPDDIAPTDFEAFYCPPGVGVNVAPFVWHAPPVASFWPGEQYKGVAGIERVVMRTKQAAVHSKIYYDPLREHNTLLKVDASDIAAKLVF